MSRIERMAVINQKNRSVESSISKDGAPLAEAFTPIGTHDGSPMEHFPPSALSNDVDNATSAPRVAYAFDRLSPDEMRLVAEARFQQLRKRRSIREFASTPIDLDVVRHCIDSAAQAPSGAHKQPWTFVLVKDPAVRREIRLAAEEEEREFYGTRAPKRWLEDLKPFDTDAEKPFLEHAPALIVVFAQRTSEAGDRHYYVQESVGIAVGFLIAALHEAGLATLTHTPSPMKFLGDILGRPDSERPYLLLPVGLPADGCTVPALVRKPRSSYLVEV